MKIKLLFLAACCLMAVSASYAQAPQQMNYQAIVRDAGGHPLPANDTVTVRFIIHNGSPSGGVAYQETTSCITNQFGLITHAIGSGGNLATVGWGSGSMYLQVEIDPAGGNNFTDMGTTQLLSVPYALYAANSAPGPVGPTGLRGAAGATGVAGAIGATGLMGLQGPTGQPGVAGPTGVQGLMGLQGPTGFGLQGVTGAQGPIGATGAVGSAGPTGVGVQGIAGATGVQGNPGITGATGAQGGPGQAGATGAQGVQGPSGMDGVQGPTGAAGPSGIDGIQGPTGAMGPSGIDGAQGVTGNMGPSGIDGATGAAGATGFIGSGSLAGNTPYWNGTDWVLNSSNIYNDGLNVGIGTVNPVYQFEVTTSNPTSGVEGISNLDTTGFAGTYYYSSGVNRGYIGYVGNSAGWCAPNSFQVGTLGNSDFNLLVSNCTPRLTVKSGTGYVGIGNTAPASLLDVNGNINAASGFRVAGAAASGNFLRGNGTNFVSSPVLATDIPAGSTNYIQNSTTLQSSANYNISGNGTVGGNLNVGGNDTVGGNMQVNGLLSIKPVTIGLVGGTSAAPLNLTSTLASYMGLLPTSASNQYYQLPLASAYPGAMVFFRDNSTSVSAYIIAPATGNIFGANTNTIYNSATGYTLTPVTGAGNYRTVLAVSDGVNWTLMAFN